MTKQEALYMAGYLDAAGFALTLDGSHGGKKKKCSLGIACGSNPDFVRHIKNIIGAKAPDPKNNINASATVSQYRKSGYTIKLNKHRDLKNFK